jgi:3-hydroxyisobutyrate dehydrogenase
LVGGQAQDLERVKPALDAMGRGVLHLGPVGSGARMKLINNFVCGVQAAALAEAIGVIEHSSLDRETALKVLADGAPGSPLLKALSERMVAHDYEVRFAAELMAKDLDYASAHAAAQGVELRTAKAARALFGDAVSRGLGRFDMSSIVEVLRATSGTSAGQ